MILELNDIEIILRKASDEEKQSIPVWDAYIEKVIIDGNILPFYGINSLVR